MPERSGTVLAFDFGAKRIGVAIGETLLGSARPLLSIVAEDKATRFARIAELIATWQPQSLALGLPLNSDGSDSPMSTRCRHFARQLATRFGLPVHLVDERYSSVEAEARLAALGHDWRACKEEVDAAAAAIILQDYFDGETHRRAA